MLMRIIRRIRKRGDKDFFGRDSGNPLPNPPREGYYQYKIKTPNIISQILKLNDGRLGREGIPPS